MNTAVKVQKKKNKHGRINSKNVAVVIDRLREAVPEDAKVHVSIEPKQDGYTGNIRVYSKFGFIFAKATASDLVLLATKLQAKFLRQFHKWKDTRGAKRDRRRLATIRYPQGNPGET